MVMTALLFTLGVIVLLLIAVRLAIGATSSDDADLSRATLELHELRCRLAVAWLGHQARTDAARVRRELDRELDDLDPGP
jgi:hypothetical protein